MVGCHFHWPTHLWSSSFSLDWKRKSRMKHNKHCEGGENPRLVSLWFHIELMPGDEWPWYPLSSMTEDMLIKISICMFSCQSCRKMERRRWIWMSNRVGVTYPIWAVHALTLATAGGLTEESSVPSISIGGRDRNSGFESELWKHVFCCSGTLNTHVNDSGTDLRVA